MTTINEKAPGGEQHSMYSRQRQARQKRPRRRRHIEDVPFYKVQHAFDELPLDPMQPFIQEKIQATGNTNKNLQRPMQKLQLFSYKSGDEFKLRKPQERQQELSQLGNAIDVLIERQLKRVRQKKRAPQNGTINKLYTATNEDGNRCKDESYNADTNPPPMLKKKSLTNEEFLISLQIKEKSVYRTMQCLQPVDPDAQKHKVMMKYNDEFQQATKLYSLKIQRRTIHLLKHIAVTMIERYPTHLIIKTLPKIDRSRIYLRDAFQFIKREQTLWPNIKPEIILLDYLFDPKHTIKETEAILIIILLMDLQQDFRYAIKWATLKFLLSYQDQRNRLALEMAPEMIEFPMVTIRGPVSWKCNFQIATNRLDQVLMVNHPVLQAINYLWYQLYDDFIVFDTVKCYRDKIPLHFDVLTETILNCCMVARDILMNDWLPRVADLVDAMIDYWKDLLPMKSKDGGRGAILFRCIHALMSRQVRRLIKRSLDHLYAALDVYKEGNEVDKYDLNHHKLQRRPFMTLNIMVVGKFYDNFNDLCGGRPKRTNRAKFDMCKNNDGDSGDDGDNDDDPNILAINSVYECPSNGVGVIMKEESAFALNESGKLLVEPYVEELPELFVSYFKKILKVGYEIPRLEYYMSQRNDQLGHLHTIDENHVDMVKLYENVRKIVAANQMGPTLYLYPIYSYYSSLFSDKIKLMTERIFEQSVIPNLPTFISFMEKVNSVIDESFFLTDFVPLNLFMLDCRRLNKVIVAIMHEIKHIVTDYFKALNQKENRRICDEFEEMSMHAGERPKETAEVVALQNYLSECKDERIVKLKDEIKKAAERVVFLLYHATLDAEEIYLNSRTFLWPHELEQVLELSGARLSVVRENLEVALKERRNKFETYLLNERKKIEVFRLRETKEFLSIDELKEKCDTSDHFMDILKKCSNEADAINVDENLLQLEITAFPTLHEMNQKMDPIEKLWKTAYKFDKCHEIWYYGPFEKLNGEEIRNDVESMSHTILKLIKQLANNPQAKRIADQVRMKIDKFKVYLPILDAICQQGLNERHWALISTECGQSVNPKLFPTLSSMIDIDILRIVGRLEEIANVAAKEFELNMQLTNMQTEWTDVRFELIKYRDSDAYILASLDDVQSLLDDHILKSQSMRGSPFIAALGKQATDWEEKLINMQDIMDIWMQVQSTWMYLEPIFNSEDIMRQMPVEGRNFKAIDRTWRQIMQNTNEDRRVIQSTDYPNLYGLLCTAFADLDKVQKGLNTYLEKKRIFFARFFFLSNDEILEILSETKDPKRVQPHLRKCFEGINSLEFDQNNEITAILSAEHEVLSLTKKINPTAANGLVEKWLKEVQTIMLESVLTQMKTAYDSYWSIKRIEWILKWCGQVAQTVSQITWTKETEEAITGCTLTQYATKYNEYINDATALIRENLSPGVLINIESMIILDIHARDVLNLLVEMQAQDIDNFNWMSQLRYYWKYDDIEKIDIVSVCMLWSDARYGMEYLGNIARLVVTPQTDRCFRAVMGALKLDLSGMALGPSGTGKTETLKDLTKAVGKKCIVFNCCISLDYNVLGKFFKGLIQTGAWVIFYDFNCIAVEVLSVTAQQILAIRQAKAKRAIKMVFQETSLKLDASCNIFVTINSDYAARSKLPENLKSQFRSFAMLVPDLMYICEMSMFVTGFNEPHVLARKLIQLHLLCTEQISHQEHYDFRIRTIKAVLRAAQTMRRNDCALSEHEIMLKAILNVNLPKLVDSDLPLFYDICKQIFPKQTTPALALENHAICQRVKKMLEKRHLQATQWIVEKILQIYSMLSMRNGIVIVGDSMVGKTSAWQTLADTLRDLKSDPIANIVEYECIYRIINPKSISLDQLYGQVDSVSQEWCDGVLARVFREMVAATSSMQSRGWIVFDGAVDPMWMESLHTLLDDNRKLCLASGEMIEKTPVMSMLFETSDLQHASPATVARCGIVYMSRLSDQWKVLHLSFVAELQQFGLIEIYVTLFETLVNWTIPALLEILDECKPILVVSATHQYKIFSQFLLNFLQKQSQLNQIWFQQTFLYCLVWAYGSTLLNKDRITLDHRLRKVLHGSNEEHPKPKLFTLNRGQMFPEKMLLTDYRFDGIETWWPWLKSDEASFAPNTIICDALVPTKESNIILNWLSVATSASIPTILVGDTGTGKSAAIRHYLNELPKDKYLSNILNLSANSKAQQVQEMVMAKLDRRRKGVFGPPVGKSCLVFADNVAIPSRDKYGSQASVELLRQWIDHKYWSDLKDTSKIELVDLLFVGAMGLIGGQNFTFSRFYRHTFLIGIDGFETSTVQRIFTVLSEWHFSQGFSDKITMLAKSLAMTMCAVYGQLKTLLIPTPHKFHYLFSLSDVLRIFKGITLVPPKKLASPEKLIRLWAHETYRVYSDRITDAIDQNHLLKSMIGSCKTNFKIELCKAFGKRLVAGASVTHEVMRYLAFGNFMEPDAALKFYDEIDDWIKLEKIINYYLNEYNSMHEVRMDLVLFKYSIEHISRISRALQMPQGHVIAVGNGGSGRKSSIKLAACMAGAEFFQFEIGKNYSLRNWREDIKRTLMAAGISGKNTVLMHCDADVRDAISFMDDIVCIMDTSELPNLFQTDDRVKIMDAMQLAAKEMDEAIDTTPAALYKFFVERIRANLHIALVVSPIADNFRKYLHCYPSISNYCTIDYFHPWPEDALQHIAEKFIASMNLSHPKLSKKPSGDSTDGAINTNSAPQNSDQMDSPLQLSKFETSLVQLAVYFHQTVAEESQKLFKEFPRPNYVTPASFLEMLKLFSDLHRKKDEEITLKRERYTIGLEKLDSAAAQVGDMQQNLFDLQPKLKQLSDETEQIMVQIERDTAEAEKKKEVVGADEAAANEAAAAAQAIKDDCDSDLQEAIPAFNAALAALNTLKPPDITIVKSMKNPPAAVKLVLEAVCVIRAIKPDRKSDPNGKINEDYWSASLKMLSDLKFLENLKTFDKDNIPVPTMKRIREKYISDRDFNPDKVKNVSTACEGLCKWIRAMDIYDRVAKIVAPKQQALAAAEAELADQMEKLNSKRSELQVILDKLQGLNDFFAEKSKQKKNLEDEIDNCEKKLDRAETLLGGLGGEKSRWLEIARILGISLENVIGDVLLASGCIAYLGCFTSSYREVLLAKWITKCIQDGIPCTENFTLAVTLSDSTQTRNWTLAGLPFDKQSVENAILVKLSQRYPLMIDPQDQANKWIRKIEKDNCLKVIKSTDDNYVQIIAAAITSGHSILLENIRETIDSALQTILERHIVYQKSGKTLIRCSEQFIEYNDNFRLYITTSLPNPHYLPEIASKVNLVDFTLTERGLQEMLLATIISVERLDLQERKENHIIESAKNRELLYRLESNILEVLSLSEGNILEDENAINILSTSKNMSEEIQAKQLAAISVEQEIDGEREQYYVVARYSSVLYRCMMQLTAINHMYQYSLRWFLAIFVDNINETPKKVRQTLAERLHELNRSFTQEIYRQISHTLYEKDRLAYSFFICIELLRFEGKVRDEEFEFLLSHAYVLQLYRGNEDVDKENVIEWLSAESNRLLKEVTKLPSLSTLREDIVNDTEKWKQFCTCLIDSEENRQLPEPYTDADWLTRLIIFKCLRPNKLLLAIEQFICNYLNELFIETQSIDLRLAFEASAPTTPLIYFASLGVNVIVDILSLAKEKNMSDKCKTISLGQNQGAFAEKAISEAILHGTWVILENCHLSIDWMERLEIVYFNIRQSTEINEDFRWWLITESTSAFPTTVLREAIKIVNDPPRTMKANLIRQYCCEPLSNDKYFSNAFVGPSALNWLRCVFALNVFHGVVQERKLFGSIGWATPYEFGDGLLKQSVSQLKIFLKHFGEIIFDGLFYLIGECHYGSEVIDTIDRRLLITLLNKFCNENAVQQNNYKFFDSGDICIPLEPNRENSLRYLKGLPSRLQPNNIGLHENAEFHKNVDEGKSFLDAVYRTQITNFSLLNASQLKQSKLELVEEICTDILKRVPLEIDIDLEKSPITPFSTILKHELIKFNHLLKLITTSLTEVRQALQGLTIATQCFDEMATEIANNQIPSKWMTRNYPTTKSLGNYIRDLLERIRFLQLWSKGGTPNVVWFSAFYFPQALITTIKWEFSRCNSIDYDDVLVSVDVTTFKTDDSAKFDTIMKESKPVSKGSLAIFGLYMDGARWNHEAHHIDEAISGEFYDRLPIVIITPIEKRTEDKIQFEAPVYRTPNRRGVFTKTGHSTNFVMFIALNSKQQPKHWIQRGASILCQLND